LNTTERFHGIDWTPQSVSMV